MYSLTRQKQPRSKPKDKEVKLLISEQQLEINYRERVRAIIMAYCLEKNINPRDGLAVARNSSGIWKALVDGDAIKPGMTFQKFCNQLCDQVWAIHQRGGR